MTVNWIEPIYDRTAADVLNAEGNPTGKNLKGCYNADDLNRIENNTRYVAEDMLERKIVRTPIVMTTKTTWRMYDIPTREDMTRIIDNINLLISLSNQEIADKLRALRTSTQFTYSLANAIEYDLEVLKNQPLLPIKTWLLTVEHGIIVNAAGERNTNMYLAEDEHVTIIGEPYGENAQYMTFNHWSGSSVELENVKDVTKQTTTYTMRWHERDDYSVTLTAEFKTKFPRRLTLHQATIGEGPLVGQSTGIFFAGDEILLRADIAAVGKRFYNFEGTQAALDNLIGGTEPSTSWLVMPDCDVDLTPKYINAGPKYKLYVDNALFGWFDYNEYVYVSATPPSNRHVFNGWAGDTKYLDGGVMSNSLRMPDVEVRISSTWTYQYSYNNITMVNGLIDGKSVGENLRQDTPHAIAANAAPAGKEFSHWSREGVGSFANSSASSTTFYVGDGNATVIANYKDIPPSHTVTIENIDNAGGSKTISVREGSTYAISSSEVLSDYIFSHWNKNGSNYSNSYYVYSITMGKEDVIYTACYRDRQYYNLEVVNGTGSGTYKERYNISIKADSPPEGYIFNRWSFENLYSYDTSTSTTTNVKLGNRDGKATANYIQNVVPNYYQLTVRQR